MRIWRETNVKKEGKKACSMFCVEVGEDKTLDEQCRIEYWHRVLRIATCYKHYIRIV